MDAKNWLHDYYQGTAMGIECKDCSDAAAIIEELIKYRELITKLANWALWGDVNSHESAYEMRDLCKKAIGQI